MSDDIAFLLAWLAPPRHSRRGADSFTSDDYFAYFSRRRAASRARDAALSFDGGATFIVYGSSKVLHIAGAVF